ncbi:signal-transducing histidine kinase/response regulator [Halodesulfurarchaeum formicicum]|uniref:histidine kinase n=1 Tax=Halodesulfurarchaeum formicicum TaxID=1873524 RepID=A0A1D8S3S9_9EURY|nr:PAS domain S-box protein [Halodesulfurarchaeum formicicum]AOW80008.1 signal-transducing histidine kinase/response regulator [Halodesulfurarchaeum formicicum]
MKSFQSALSFSAFIDEIPDGLLLVDGSGQVTDLNERIEEMFGYAPEGLLGEPIEILVPDRYEEEHVGLRNSYLEAPKRRPMGTELILQGQRADGSTFPIQVSLAPIEHDNRTLVLASVRDISERVQYQQQASVLNRILRHNIRNRLNIIQGNVDLVLERMVELESELDAVDQRLRERSADGSFDASMLPEELRTLYAAWREFPTAARERLQTIEASGLDLLDLADRARRLEEAIHADHEQTGAQPIRTTIMEAIADVRSRYEHAQIEVESIADAELSSNPQFVQIALDELLTNAIRHAEVEQPTVTVRTARTDSAYRIEIEDDGPGIPETELEALEQPQEEQLEHGMGLGLWEATWLVDQLGGDLTFENQAEGALVRIWLPR